MTTLNSGVVNSLLKEEQSVSKNKKAFEPSRGQPKNNKEALPSPGRDLNTGSARANGDRKVKLLPNSDMNEKNYTLKESGGAQKGCVIVSKPPKKLLTGQQRRTASSNGTPKQQQISNQRSRANYAIFKPYMTEDEIHVGLQNGALFKGVIRINQRKFEEAFMNNPDGSEHADVAILGMPDRNRALQGDVVAARIKPRAAWVVNEEFYKNWKQKSCREHSKCCNLDEVMEVLEDIVIAASEANPATHLPQEKSDTPDTMLGSGNGESLGDVMSEKESSIDEQIIPVMKKVSDSIDPQLGQEMNNEAAIASGDSKKTTTASPNNDKEKTKRRASYRVLSELPLEDWSLPDVCLQKTAEVVGIVEKKNSRLATGKLELCSTNQRRWAKFSPTDSRIPRMMIEASQLPKEFFDRPQDFSKFVFVAKIAEWPENSIMARGNLEKQLGIAGDIDVETEGLLMTNEIDTREFSEEVIACLPSVPSENGWKIEQEELSKRRDLRNEIIFTIDPKTARDLDDALSISRCEDVDGCGTLGWEVGVHIADVSHFVFENTELDNWASKRANSVYLVHQVIPMLPRLLCEQLCSLNAGVDRLTFSVIWKMNEKGDIYEEWFGRTVIRSRVKLAYEHAQDFIENPDKDFLESEVPEISDGTTVHEVKEKVLQLHRLARLLRERRSQNGSLQLDQPKLKFVLDDENKMPIGVSIYQAKDANKLVEEFMLLANMAVARKIERHYMKTALLRLHPPPKAKILRDAIKTCSSVGFPINGTTSQQLSSSLAPFRSNTPLLRCINQVLSMTLMKAMELARYFCTGSVPNQSHYHHFALNVPFYTHFTSPIRRYPDIIVHRLLASSLDYCEPSQRSVKELEKIAEHCNDKKLVAKKVSEASEETFFGLFVQRVGPMEAKGVVVNVLDAAFDVLLFKYGVIKRVYVNALELSQEPLFRESPNRLTLFWQHGNAEFEQLIQMCTLVDVVLSGLPEPTKFQAVIKPRSSEQSPTLLELWRQRQNCNDDVNDVDPISLD